MYGNSTRENRAAPGVPAGASAGRAAKAMSHKADMHASGESDGRVVLTKGPNNGEQAAPAEDLEGRRPTKENTEQSPSLRTQGRDGRESRGLPGVREAARQDKRMRFTALLHHVTIEQLRGSFLA